MLMLIGPLRFKVAPLHLNEVSHSYGASHVAKPVIGAVEPLEFTGKVASPCFIPQIAPPAKPDPREKSRAIWSRAIAKLER